MYMSLSIDYLGAHTSTFNILGLADSHSARNSRWPLGFNGSPVLSVFKDRIK